jgi:hypothetical protein
MPTKRVAPAETPATTKKGKATAEQVAAAAEVASQNGDKRSRRSFGGRNWLAREIDRVLREASGPLTVKEITEQVTNSAGEHPSSGAVAAALQRWADADYIKVTAKPLAFKSFSTPYAKGKGTFDTFEEKARAQRAADRAAAKA